MLATTNLWFSWNRMCRSTLSEAGNATQYAAAAASCHGHVRFMCRHTCFAPVISLASPSARSPDSGCHTPILLPLQNADWVGTNSRIHGGYHQIVLHRLANKQAIKWVSMKGRQSGKLRHALFVHSKA